MDGLRCEAGGGGVLACACAGRGAAEYCLRPLDGREHALGRRGGVVQVTRRIVGRLADGDVLHHAVVHVEREALAAQVAQGGHGARGWHGHVERLAQLAAGVRKEGDVRAGDPLILGPRLHHGRVIDAVHEDLIDALVANFVPCRLVARHLVLGSGGRESTGEPDNDDLLGGNVLGDVEGGGRPRGLVNVNVGELGADGDGTSVAPREIGQWSRLNGATEPTIVVLQ